MSQRQSHSSPSASFPLLLGSGGQTRGPPNARGVTWMVISRQIPAPISEGSPYIPVITYTMDWPMVMIMPNTRKQRELCSQGGASHTARRNGHGTPTVRGGRPKVKAVPPPMGVAGDTAAPMTNAFHQSTLGLEPHLSF